MTRTLVTGATGFIGRHLVPALVEAGDEVHCLARDATRASELLPDDAHIHHAMPTIDLDVVVDLAAVGVLPADRADTDLVAANVHLMETLLRGLPDVIPVIHVGSCSEYAPVDRPGLTTEATRLDPPSVYGRAKVAATRAGLELAKRQGRHFVVVRPFGVYGPGEAPTRLLPSISARLLAGEPAELTGGEQVRDFTFVADVARALVVASRPGALPDGSVFNICSGVPRTVREMAEAMAREIGAPGELLRFGRLPYREDEPMWIVGDPARFAGVTGWKPQISLADGIRETIRATRDR